MALAEISCVEPDCDRRVAPADLRCILHSRRFGRLSATNSQRLAGFLSESARSIEPWLPASMGASVLPWLGWTAVTLSFAVLAALTIALAPVALGFAAVCSSFSSFTVSLWAASRSMTAASGITRLSAWVPVAAVTITMLSGLFVSGVVLATLGFASAAM